MLKFFGSTLCASLIVFTTNVRADEDGSFVNYEVIVNELKASIDEERPAPARDDEDGWEEVAIHGTVGLATSYVSVTSPDGVAGRGLLKGVQFGFGMNLFTRLLRAEGAFSSYAQEELDRRLKADLKEFELCLVYLAPMQDGITLRLGAGLSARYLSLDARSSENWSNSQSSTPSSVLLMGFERKYSKTLAFGPDLSYRNSLVGDTYDKSAWNASFRLNATF